MTISLSGVLVVLAVISFILAVAYASIAYLVLGLIFLVIAAAVSGRLRL